MITVISGTNRPNSYSIRLANYYLDALAGKGETVSLLSLNDLPGTITISDLYGNRSEEFTPFQDKIDTSDKFIFIIPEYNGSFPGILKVFMDACSFPDSFSGKKAALVGISSGRYGNIRGIDHFTGVCNYCGLHVLPLRIHIPMIKEEISKDNQLLKEDTRRFVHEQIDKLIQF